MTDQQMLSAIAVTLAAKGAETLAEGGRTAFKALARLVRRRFEGRVSARAALSEAEADPADVSRVGVLRQALTQAAAEDPPFAADLRDLWQTLLPHLNAGDGDLVNSLFGHVEGNVVQARDIHCGVSFGAPGRNET
ncbi:hypothetical protein [Dactylosporangium sp. CA-092794]|uniref:hypothetical protein n=1 Tax=Dactylosporangium sp. CA-092794 TaxID=3239929 RepID=UPI003D8FE8ED